MWCQSLLEIEGAFHERVRKQAHLVQSSMVSEPSWGCVVALASVALKTCVVPCLDEGIDVVAIVVFGVESCTPLPLSWPPSFSLL